MSISKYPSTVTLPPANKPYPLMIDFFVKRFPNIEKTIWEQRITGGKILDEDGNKISFSTTYVPGKKLHYFRESQNEPQIPFKENIIYENENYLIVDKPHFLPVIPSGPYVNECLLNRLKKSTGNNSLTPVNRIDRETAGLVMISCNTDTRGIYSTLFEKREVTKSYEAITEYTSFPDFPETIIKNRLTKGSPWFRMGVEEGEINAITKISPIKFNNKYLHFSLEPVTGKKHQLRIHLSGMGCKIINDRYYPQLLEKKDTDFNNPLQLLAKQLTFTDPVNGKQHSFTSRLSLLKDW